MNAHAPMVAVPRPVGGDASPVMAELARIFHDRAPQLLGETARTFFIEMVSVHVARAPADADLTRAALDQLGIDAGEMANWRKIEDDPVSGRRFALMLEHTHALEAWCCAPLLKDDGRPTLLLHIDAHDDLNGPSLLPDADRRKYLAPLGSDVMTLDDPKTVRRFATRGYIGIGGFIAPMIGSAAIDAMLHVPGPAQAGGRGAASLAIGLAPDSGFIRVEKQNCARPGIPYHRMHLEAALEVAHAFDGHILLDIDLDAFCNRYDTHGDSEVADADALIAMAEAAQLLTASGLPRRAAVTTVALSPGFFPGSLWPEALRFADAMRAQSIG
ncbi:hypothetical protein [Massilia scottii]|uniref:hypothetical protein n=1 Tax=Massilia scottii TaxID=3057166 RepID=UPI002796B636|nr:hypothetical protein [Massilia sp. CCM 9029]MDQ1833645.1 hypothetical protein [Massilia sp. CCM 9029]